jgi:hypothetical protein
LGQGLGGMNIQKKADKSIKNYAVGKYWQQGNHSPG